MLLTRCLASVLEWQYILEKNDIPVEVRERILSKIKYTKWEIKEILH